MFAQTSVKDAPDGPFIVLSSVESTNNYAMAKLHAGMLTPQVCFLALSQTAGKGQRGKQWHAAAGANITMSAVFQPRVYKPFVYSAAMALACYDFMEARLLHNIRLKWPNDIYLDDRKAGGILIENIYRGGQWAYAVTGIGINLNQTDFPDPAHRAISLRQLTGCHYDIINEGKALYRCLLWRHRWATGLQPELVMEEYNTKLYKRGSTVRLRKGNISFDTVIERVTDNGELVTRDALERRFRVGEVEFL